MFASACCNAITENLSADLQDSMGLIFGAAIFDFLKRREKLHGFDFRDRALAEFRKNIELKAPQNVFGVVFGFPAPALFVDELSSYDFKAVLRLRVSCQFFGSPDRRGVFVAFQQITSFVPALSGFCELSIGVSAEGEQLLLTPKTIF
jgi:hypothetical protein